MKLYYLVITIFISFLYSTESYSMDIKDVSTDTVKSMWLIEDKNVPIVSVRIAFKNSGAAYDGESVSGLSNFVSLMLDEGAGEYDSESFINKLADKAIGLDFSADKDNFYVSLRTLSKNLDEALELLVLSITEPRFDKKAIEKSKRQLLVSLSKKQESPKYLARREWEKFVYKNHPYSNPILGRKESIENITKVHMSNFIERNFVRDSMHISVVGDVSESELKSLANKYLVKIPDSPHDYTEVPEFDSFPEGKVKYFKKPYPQTVVYFGMPSVKVSDKNFYPMHLINFILGGGGFESRLMKEIRNKKGLAYSAYSYLSIGDKSPLLEGFFSTDASKVYQSIAIFQKEISKLKENGITDEELELAKNYSIGSFALRMDSYDKLVHLVNFIQTQGLGKDYIKKRNKLIEAVSMEEIKNAIDDIFIPSKMLTIAVGEAK